MDIFAVAAIALFFSSIIALYFRPELIVGIQLFSTPIFGNALSGLGLNIGAVYVIFTLAVFSLALTIRREGIDVVRPSSTLEVLILLFITWVATTLIYTPSPSYGLFKLLSLMIIMFPCAYLARIHCDTPKKLYRTFTTAGLYAICLLIFFGSYVLTNYVDVIRINSSFFNALSLGYIIASMVPFIIFTVFYSNSSVLRLTAITAIVCSLFIVFATGSRGPLLAMIISILFAFFSFRYFFRAVIVFSIATVAITYYATTAAQSGHRGLERILGLTDAGSRSDEGREVRFFSAIEQFKEYPLFGQGSGSFSYFFSYSDTVSYAHNTILEIAGEFGLLGLVVYFAILILCILQIKKLRRAGKFGYKPLFWALACIQALFVVGFTNSNISGSLSSQKILFVSIGILAATTCWRSRRDEARG